MRLSSFRGIQKRDGAIVLGIVGGLVWFKDCNDICSMPDLGEVEG